MEIAFQLKAKPFQEFLKLGQQRDISMVADTMTRVSSRVFSPLDRLLFYFIRATKKRELGSVFRVRNLEVVAIGGCLPAAAHREQLCAGRSPPEASSTRDGLCSGPRPICSITVFLFKL